jgi:hypothetical protein
MLFEAGTSIHMRHKERQIRRHGTKRSAPKDPWLHITDKNSQTHKKTFVRYMRELQEEQGH